MPVPATRHECRRPQFPSLSPTVHPSYTTGGEFVSYNKELGVATHIVKTSLFSLLLCAVIVGCAHHPTPTQTGFTPPWHVVSTRVAALVDQHASRSAFESYRESSRPAERLRTFSAVEHLTSSRHYSAAERAEHRAWFRSASSVWYYTFECQYSGILFTDASGHVRHALLFG